MSLSSLIDYLLKHNETVIQWLIVLIIGMISYLSIRSVFRKPSASSGSARSSAAAGGAIASTEQIEELLNKILEKTNKWDQAAPAGVAAAAPSGSDPGDEAGGGVSAQELEAAKAELSQLKAALQKKEAELSEAVASGGTAGGGEAGGSNKQYLEKISELEAKLGEYEVLEDDIADLSLYKEENARLKAEVERLRGGDKEEAEVSSPSPVPEPDLADDLVREFAEAVGKEPAKEQAGDPQEEISPLVAEEVESADLEPAPAPSVSDDDMAALNEMAAAAADPSAEPPPAAEASPAEPPPPTQAAVDDLFAELASNDLDTDKMVSELAALQNLGETGSADEALAEGLDPDKIAEEADEFKS